MPTHEVVIHLILGPMSALSLLVCSWSVYKHLTGPGSDAAHALTIRILLMVPIYSFVSWLSLMFRFTTFAGVLTTFQKVYECITLFAFLQLLVVYLGGGRPRGALERCRHKLSDHECHHLIPVKWFVAEDSWSPPATFLRKSIGLVAWYVPIMLVCFLITAVAYLTPAIKAVMGICGGVNFVYTCVAMYGLILFYHANMVRLEPVRPLSKFISIKLLVIIMGWQEMLLKVAVHLGLFDNVPRLSRSHYTPEQFSEACLSACMVVEMLILSLVHLCVYPSTEALYDVPPGEADPPRGPPCGGAGAGAEGEGAGRRGACRRARMVLNVGDIYTFVQELRTHAPDRSLDRIITEPTCGGCLHYFCCCEFLRGSGDSQDDADSDSDTDSESTDG